MSVSLSGDGSTALAGGPGSSGGSGAAWVFERSGSSWADGQRLTGTGEAENMHFGNSVALSEDAGTAVVGAREHVGAAWVFGRSGSGWAQQGPRLTDPEEASSPPQFGYSVAVSGDGSLVLIGGPADESATGAAWLYTRAGETWSQDGEKLTGAESSGAIPRKGKFGYSVALRADGETAVVGAPWDLAKTGAMWAFAEPRLLPAVSAVSPSSGPASGGTPVTIEGNVLAGATSVAFEAASASSPAASFTVNPSGTITAIAPPSPTGQPVTVHVRVTGPSGTSPASAASRFTYLPSDSGQAGSSVAGVGTGSPGPLGGVLGFTSGCTPALVSRNLSVGSRSRAAVRLVWRGHGTCRGRLTLRISLKQGRRYRLKALGATTAFTLSPGRVLTVRVKLNKIGRSLLHRHRGRLAASMLIVKVSPGGTRAHTAKVVLVVPKPKKKPHKPGG